MWKEYSRSYIKNNRSSGISVMVAAFISALFLSLLCSLFYNLWKYEVERIQIEEGSWQGRIEGSFDEDTLAAVKNFPNIEKVVINQEGTEGEKAAVDLYFEDMGTILEDLPKIAKLAEVPPEAVSCHHSGPAGYCSQTDLSAFSGDNRYGLYISGHDHTQFLRCDYECQGASVWYIFQYRSYTGTDSDLSAAGGCRIVCSTGSVR